MLNRVIQDIYYLRKVHSTFPDAVLGDTLKNKLLRLSLQPSLQHLKHKQLHGQPLASLSSSPSPRSSHAPVTAKDPSKGSAWGGGNTAVGSSRPAEAPSPYVISPRALCYLIDSLAYFHLGTSAVASEAVQLVQLAAPTMTTPQVCTTLAACCALGAQQDITATALPLLSAALNYYTADGGDGQHHHHHHPSRSPSSPLSASQSQGSSPYRAGTAGEDGPLMFAQGASVMLLMEALQKAGVREREVWHLLAEHCLRFLDAFDGRQLSTVVSVLCAEGVDDYPDFFVAAERHITSQPSNYLSPHLLQHVVQCYKELHQPVVSLLALVHNTPLYEEDLDRSISGAAAATALSGPQHGAHVEQRGAVSLGGPGNAAARSGMQRPLLPASVQQSLTAFESAAVSALAAADAQTVLDLLGKCVRRRVMTPGVMDAVMRRLLTLYYPLLSPAPDREGKRKSGSAVGGGFTSGMQRSTISSSNSSGSGGGGVGAEGVGHSSLDLHRLSQCILIALEFNDVALFLPLPAEEGEEVSKPPSAASTRPHTKGKKTRKGGASAPAAPAAMQQQHQSPPLPLISRLLDALGQELDHWYHPRLLEVVTHTVRLLPRSSQPHNFYAAVVAHLRRSNDLSSHEGPRVLRCLVEALLALRQCGGEAALNAFMPAITVAVLNTPRSSQLELTALLAHLPAAARELVPGVYRQWGSQKRWLRTITEAEVGNGLQIMARSGQRDSPLLHAAVGFVQAHGNELPPQRVVEYLHQLARLGVRDLELFTHTAEHLMRRAVESTPSFSSAPGVDRGASGRLRAAASAGAMKSANTTAAAAAAASGSGGGGSAQTASATTSSSSPTGVPATASRHWQWQVTTVHDLALLLFTFTFVLRDTIRVTQQIIARLKMCSSAATPRDISLSLYSFVKLRVTRADEVTNHLCERAVVTLRAFKSAELASMWSSLRCLHHLHVGLHQATLDLLDAVSTGEGEGEGEEAAEEDGAVAAAGAPPSPPPRPLWRFTDADLLSLGSALLLTEPAPLNLNHPLVRRRREVESGGDSQQPPPLPLPQEALDVTAAADGSPLTAPALATVTNASASAKAPLPPDFERGFVDVCRRLLPNASGQRLYLILSSLGRCQTTPQLSLSAWETVLTLVEKHAEGMTTGRLEDSTGAAQLEVLGALRVLHARVADADALAAADAVRADSTASWVVPYCPPGLWSVLRPRWRELMQSPAVQTQAGVAAAVAEIRGSGSEGRGMETVPTGKAKRRSLQRRTSR